MKNFIKLTSFATEENTYVDAGTITSVHSQTQQSGESTLTIVRVNDATFCVKESSDEIMELIKKALDKSN